ncbi:hypothetical protein BDN71DRAFT_1593413, partial [Pleurotus eryngii]
WAFELSRSWSHSRTDLRTVTLEPALYQSRHLQNIYLHEFHPASSGFRLLFYPSTLAPEGAAHENENAPTSGHWRSWQLSLTLTRRLRERRKPCVSNLRFGNYAPKLLARCARDPFEREAGR